MIIQDFVSSPAYHAWLFLLGFHLKHVRPSLHIIGIYASFALAIPLAVSTQIYSRLSSLGYLLHGILTYYHIGTPSYPSQL